MNTIIKKKSKGFAFNSLWSAGLGLVVLTIILATGALILDEYQDQTVVNSTSYNLTQSGLTSLDVFGDWFTIIVIVIIAVVILGLVMMFGRGTGGMA